MGWSILGCNGVTFEGIRCYKCNFFGHHAKQCPSNIRTNATQVGFCLLQNNHQFKRTWILLDTCSTHSMSNNSNQVHNISRCADSNILVISTNGGDRWFTQKVTLNIFWIKVHFNESSLANILSLKDIAKFQRGPCNHGHC